MSSRDWNAEEERREPSAPPGASSQSSGGGNVDIAEFLRGLGSPRRSGFNPHYSSHYSTRDDVQAAVDPSLEAWGFAIHYSVSWTNPEHRCAEVEARLVDRSGDIHLPVSSFPFIVSDDPQKTAKAISYGMRIAAVSLLGLVSEDDDDGNQAAGKGSAPRNSPPQQRAQASPPPPRQAPPQGGSQGQAPQSFDWDQNGRAGEVARWPIQECEDPLWQDIQSRPVSHYGITRNQWSRAAGLIRNAGADPKWVFAQAKRNLGVHWPGEIPGSPKLSDGSWGQGVLDAIIEAVQGGALRPNNGAEGDDDIPF